jgi:hypothetical protein
MMELFMTGNLIKDKKMEKGILKLQIILIKGILRMMGNMEKVK